MLTQSILCPTSPSLSSSSGSFFTSLSLFCPTCLKHSHKHKLHASLTHSNPNFLALNDQTHSISDHPNGPSLGEEISFELYNSSLQDFCRAGHVDKAMALLAQMEAIGLRPNSVSYFYLIDALGSIGRTLEADVLFQEMIFLGLRPRIKLYNEYG